MAKCEVCGNDYDKSFTVTMKGTAHTFDSFECAIHALAPWAFSICFTEWRLTTCSISCPRTPATSDMLLARANTPRLT